MFILNVANKGSDTHTIRNYFSCTNITAGVFVLMFLSKPYKQTISGMLFGASMHVFHYVNTKLSVLVCSLEQDKHHNCIAEVWHQKAVVLFP